MNTRTTGLVPRRESELSTWDWNQPWRDVMERFFSPVGLRTFEEGSWLPRTDVKETPESYEFFMDVPGMKPENIDVCVTGDTITITGKKEEEERKEGENFFVRERRFGSFERSFTFPGAVDSDHVEAEITDGVLHVKVAKAKAYQPKKIQVKKA